MRRIGFLGPRATFAEQALRTLPEAADAELVACNGSPAVLAAVRAGTVDAGFVPFENTVEGAVPAVLDGLVDDPPLLIVREAVLAPAFDLMVRPGTRAADVRTVASHPHAIAQTRAFLAAHLPAAAILMATSTAEAAVQVARGEFDAAVASPLAAQQFELDVLAADIADNAGAVTRFALLAPPGPAAPPTGDDRTSLAATTQNRPGSLLGLLTELAVRGIDLTRIESRPIKGRHAEYWFHLDCLGHVAEPAMGEALAALHRRCDRVRFLGSYPRVANGRATAGSLAGPAMGAAGSLAGPAMGAAGSLAGPAMGAAGSLAGPAMGAAGSLAGPAIGAGAPGTPVIGPSDAEGFAAAASWLERLRAGTAA